MSDPESTGEIRARQQSSLNSKINTGLLALVLSGGSWFSHVVWDRLDRIESQHVEDAKSYAPDDELEQLKRDVVSVLANAAALKQEVADLKQSVRDLRRGPR